ncbi:N-acetylglucosamine kinase [Rhizobium sp. SG_E_25_P2]|uniref:ROK family protein n=1 Tax=Rhizobium sp. SG_E_25_P2 TaxID=2879942 RepID=UPI0024763AE6|nr:ROK family protein [Rhizobium sp. SG_E_25_P2]MDH6264640.1 N-acetylglucosamine kinase [Rhizobium sp. SG_E_25_P2]
MILALDIGGSFIKAAWSPEPGKLEPIGRIATPSDSLDAFVSAIVDLTKAAPSSPQALAISLTGIVDRDSGRLTCANIPALHQTILAPALEAALGLPVLIANDADCFALAEAARGAGRGRHVVFGVILGSGVGGGLVSGGRLVNSAGGYAGEWGHGAFLPAVAGDPPERIPAFECGCGRKGCLNTVGGARGLEALHRHLHGTNADSHAILAAWEADDPAAARTVDIYSDLVARLLALAINITGAEIAPVGGGLANSEKLLSNIDRKTKPGVLGVSERPLVVQAQCGPDAGLIGAAALGWSMNADERNSAGSVRG